MTDPAFAGISNKLMQTIHLHPWESDAETWLGYWWLNCHCHWRIFHHVWLKFRYTWDLQSSIECGSAISIKPTSTPCDSLLLYHSIPGMPHKWQISHWSGCTLGCCAQYVLLYPFSSCLLQLWISGRCAQGLLSIKPWYMLVQAANAALPQWIYESIHHCFVTATTDKR